MAAVLKLTERLDRSERKREKQKTRAEQRLSIERDRDNLHNIFGTAEKA
jgi:hypothetical protein